MYEAIHKTVQIALRWFFMLPLLVFTLAFMILILPVMALALVAGSDSWPEFRDKFVDLYWNMPYDFFRWCILGE